MPIKMIRTALLAAASTMILVPAAQAQHSYGAQDCESQRQGRQVAGALVGAILGGVIGAQIEDSVDDRDNHRGGRYGRGRHGGGRYNRGRDRGNENDVAVVAGAGIGALVGAGVAGGNPCGPQYNPNQDSGYYGDPYQGKPSGYDDAYYGEDSYAYDDGYNDAYAYQNDGYAQDYGSNSLAGAPESHVYTQPNYTGDARVYSANSVSANCRYMQSRVQNSYGQVTTNDVYMCQGSDGIWRPAQ
tara:strand:- start:412 stop:1140 length:729 start_codon:yes stop_codon:yes gene_type:complete